MKWEKTLSSTCTIYLTAFSFYGQISTASWKQLTTFSSIYESTVHLSESFLVKEKRSFIVLEILVYNKNTSIKKEKETSSTLTNTKYLKECCKRYRVTFLKKTNLKKCDKKKIEKMLLKMMPKTLDDLCENSDYDLTVKDLYETEINDLDQSSFLDSSLDTSLNTTFGSTFWLRILIGWNSE